ncbi:MAG: dihydrofolate reductase [Ornithinimicrobium sp.]
MRQPRFSVIPSVYLFLLREGDQGLEVLLQLRRGTPYMDEWWASGAAGHVERGESIHQAAAREAREELGVDVAAEDLEPLATLHRTTASPDPMEERIDLFFVVRVWRGDPVIAEPDKAAELRWWPMDALPGRIVPHEAQALAVVTAGRAMTVLTRGFDQRLTLVAAVGRNGVIGDGTGMPWHLPEDLRHFKEVTGGGTMLMGRRTFDSIGRALPGRRSIVITRDGGWHARDVEVARSMAEALLIAGDGEIFVIGGGQIYEQTITFADRLVITEVHQEPEGSVAFPAIDPDIWEVAEREARDGFAFVTWRRREPT